MFLCMSLYTSLCFYVFVCVLVWVWVCVAGLEAIYISVKTHNLTPERVSVNSPDNNACITKNSFVSFKSSDSPRDSRQPSRKLEFKEL